MQAMLIEDDPAARTRAAQALARVGFEVTVAGSVDAAKAAVRRGTVDVLVMAERVGGRLAHDVALLAELRNPVLGTILMSDRTSAEADEMFELLPSLHAVLGRGTPARTLAHLAVAAARLQGHAAPVPDPAEGPADAALAAGRRDVAAGGFPEPQGDPPMNGAAIANPPFGRAAAGWSIDAEDKERPAAEADDRRRVEEPQPTALDGLDDGRADQRTLSPTLGSNAVGTPLPPRIMPPPLPAPAKVPSFLRPPASGAGGQAHPPAAAVGDGSALVRPRARRLHLA